MRNIVLIISLLLAVAAHSQENAIVVVKYRLIHVYDTTKPNATTQEIMQLRISNSAAEFSSFEFENEYKKYREGSGFILQADGSKVHGSAYPANYVLKSSAMQYHFFNEKKAYCLYNDIFQFYVGYAFDLPDIKWTITEEKRKIGNIPCQKASGWVMGRFYEAWFAPGVTVPTGPGKLHGLPGLILEAYDSKKHVQYRLFSIENIEKEKRILQLPARMMKISRAKYDALMETIQRNPFAMSVVAFAASEEAADRFLIDNAALVAKQKLSKSEIISVKVNNPIDLPGN